ncbi:MAG TPA: polysaccharide deacetylase family protein [Anaerolineales bacterium]
MNKQNFLLRFFLLTLSLFAVLLSACQPQTPTADPNAMMTEAVQTAFASIQQTHVVSTPVPAKTSVPTPTVPQTPPALPATFTTTALNPLDTPHTYINDSCQYLKAKWTSTNAVPGTIVIPIMFHSITKGTVTDPNQISVHDFNQLMNSLHNQNFTAISMQQMMDFMYNNAKIPARSVLLIQDDRKTAQNFTDHFLPFYKQWGWPVTNGWISAFGGTDPVLAENVALSQQGWISYQAHGATSPHVPIDSTWTDDMIMHDLQGSMNVIQQYFGKAPFAYIWPGGGFSPHAVQLARQVGYKLGFTINPRGPVMFNWVPLADQIDPQRPLLIAEGPANDPLMTLPRIWDVDAQQHLGTFVAISNAASAYAQQNKAVETQYYNIVCAPKDGPIP